MFQLEDPSLMFAGIAVHAAFILGLPRALTSTGPVSSMISQEHREAMAKTWLACFSVHTRFVLIWQGCNLLTFVRKLVYVHGGPTFVKRGS